MAVPVRGMRRVISEMIRFRNEMCGMRGLWGMGMVVGRYSERAARAWESSPGASGGPCGLTGSPRRLRLLAMTESVWIEVSSN